MTHGCTRHAGMPELLIRRVETPDFPAPQPDIRELEHRWSDRGCRIIGLFPILQPRESVLRVSGAGCRTTSRIRLALLRAAREQE